MPFVRINALVGGIVLSLLAIAWSIALFLAPADAHQGEVYRIMYMHVPSAMGAFFMSLVLFIASMVGLLKRSEKAMVWARSAAEVGLLLTIMCLASGSIWGRPTWGTWWTWDARLTTTLILALLYAGFIALYTSLPPGPTRTRASAILGIIIFIDVPIIYKSVTWWRTLHQPQSILRVEGSTMDPEMLRILLLCMAALIATACWLIISRYRTLRLAEEVERLAPLH